MNWNVLQRWNIFHFRYKKIKLKHNTARARLARGSIEVILTIDVLDYGGWYISSKKIGLKHRTCKTSRGHFASLVGSKKVPATW